MKQLFTLCLVLMSVTAMAQWPSLPYNPDENGDGLIGVVDLAALLAQYNTEFASAVVSEDGESAIVYMGDIRYSDCAMSCRLLPGYWQIADLAELSLVWSEVAPTSGHQNLWTWINSDATWNSELVNLRRVYSRDYNSDDYEVVDFTNRLDVGARCYCSAKQLPRVEYFLCSTDQPEEMQSCVDSKVAEGWYLLGSPYWANHSGNSWNQALWRWAE